MKHFKRSNTYKASNVTFNLDTREAYSYDWWCFVMPINGKIVFNSYSYSPSTGGHQYKVRRLLKELGIKIDFEFDCPKGLQSNQAFTSAVEHYQNLISELNQAIEKPRSQKRKNEERKNQINEYLKTIKKINALRLNIEN